MEISRNKNTIFYYCPDFTFCKEGPLAEVEKFSSTVAQK